MTKAPHAERRNINCGSEFSPDKFAAAPACRLVASCSHHGRQANHFRFGRDPFLRCFHRSLAWWGMLLLLSGPTLTVMADQAETLKETVILIGATPSNDSMSINVPHGPLEYDLFFQIVKVPKDAPVGRLTITKFQAEIQPETWWRLRSVSPMPKTALTTAISCRYRLKGRPAPLQAHLRQASPGHDVQRGAAPCCSGQDASMGAHADYRRKGNPGADPVGSAEVLDISTLCLDFNPLAEKRGL